MCGIAGLLGKNKSFDIVDSFKRFVKSSDLMNHRGPDYKGVVEIDNLLLIHYRLSIIDLDSRANQPFVSESKRFKSIFNGEIYNYLELKKQYALPSRTTSDTEVLVELFEQQGSKIIKEWNGIFSVALCDQKENELHLIRDRFGVKPLYIYEDEDVLAFASEAKVILDWLPSFSIHPLGLSQYLWYGNTTGEQTIVKGIKKVKPGTHLTFDVKTGKLLRSNEFWKLSEVREQKVDFKHAVKEVRSKLEAAVQRQLVADVPIGVLLSGGIDSSAIVAFASQHYSGTLDTYSVEYDYNIGGKSELAKAAMVAKKYKTNHHELEIKANDVLNTFSDLVFQYDEPFADAANIPLYQLAKVCSMDKKVILQGDGGDELFAGYRRYNVLDSYHFWKWASLGYRFIPNGRWRERMKRLAFVLWQPDDAHRMAYYLTQDVPYNDPFQILSTDWQENVAKEEQFVDYINASVNFSTLDRVQKLLYTDTSILLPNTYLEKVDKATMLNSVEARVPFLDNELADYILSLPSSVKVRHGEKKYLLKKALANVVPDEILYGPKRGFDVPYKEWLKKDLYDFAAPSFSNSAIGIMNSSTLSTLLEAHKFGRKDYGPLLWKALVLSQWLNFYKDKIEG